MKTVIQAWSGNNTLGIIFHENILFAVERL